MSLRDFLSNFFNSKELKSEQKVTKPIVLKNNEVVEEINFKKYYCVTFKSPFEYLDPDDIEKCGYRRPKLYLCSEVPDLENEKYFGCFTVYKRKIKETKTKFLKDHEEIEKFLDFVKYGKHHDGDHKFSIRTIVSEEAYYLLIKDNKAITYDDYINSIKMRCKEHWKFIEDFYYGKFKKEIEEHVQCLNKIKKQYFSDINNRKYCKPIININNVIHKEIVGAGIYNESLQYQYKRFLKEISEIDTETCISIVPNSIVFKNIYGLGYDLFGFCLYYLVGINLPFPFFVNKLFYRCYPNETDLRKFKELAIKFVDSCGGNTDIYTKYDDNDILKFSNGDESSYFWTLKKENIKGGVKTFYHYAKDYDKYSSYMPYSEERRYEDYVAKQLNGILNSLNSNETKNKIIPILLEMKEIILKYSPIEKE